MKNIIQEKPTEDLSGRLFTTTQFVSVHDIKDKTVVDIGSGYGWFELYALKKKVKKIIGIEITKEDLQTAKKHIKNSKVDFLIGSAIAIPVRENASVDTVVSWEVIEHIPSKTEETMFGEVSRILKKNGVFYLSTPYRSFAATFLDPAWWLIGHRHYTAEDLISYGENNGLSAERVIVRAGWWSIISLWNMYIAKWIWKRQRFFPSFFQQKEDMEYQKKGFVNIFIKFRKQ